MYLLWKANAVIAYNNRPATEAVPYFEQVLITFILVECQYCNLSMISLL